MKSSQILTRAAELVDSGQYGFACDAIMFSEESGIGFSKAEKLFRKLYNHNGKKWEGTWYTGWFGCYRNTGNQNHRVIALLMAAAIAESEGD